MIAPARAPRVVRPFKGFDTSSTMLGLGAPMSPTVVAAYKYPEMTNDPARVARVVQVLQAGAFVGGTFHLTPKCPLCAMPLGARMRRTGVYEWLDGSEHYVESHQLWAPGLTGLSDLPLHSVG